MTTNSVSRSDYVFAPSYKLAPLDEVEQYVKEHQHLPGVPSAQEVVKEGVDMVRMDAKLLEKIEETTLYLLQLKKEVEQLREENRQLRQEVNQLKK